MTADIPGGTGPAPSAADRAPPSIAANIGLEGHFMPEGGEGASSATRQIHRADRNPAAPPRRRRRRRRRRTRKMQSAPKSRRWLATARGAAAAYAAGDRSDPFAYHRALSHILAGVAGPDDYGRNRRV